MSLTDFLPKDVSLTVAMALCAVAFVSGTARGFSGFGSALIFMPLASSIAAPRLVAALLLVIASTGAAPLLPAAWRRAARRATAVIVLGALVGVPVGTYFLSVLEPVTTRWIISCFVAALLLLLLSGWRYRGKDHAWLSVGIGSLSGFCSGLAQTGGPPIVGYWLGPPLPPIRPPPVAASRPSPPPAPSRARVNFLFVLGGLDFVWGVGGATRGRLARESLVLSRVVGRVWGSGVPFGASLFEREGPPSQPQSHG